jgi:excisionase family DNA binding protein
MNDQHCKTISVPEAGEKYLGLKRNSAYLAASKGYIPTIRLGRKVRVPVEAMEKMLKAVEVTPAT